MMLYFKNKPTFLSKNIMNFKIRADRFMKIQRKLDFFHEHIYSKGKALRSAADSLREERNKYYKYISPSAKFRMFTKHSAIPDYILGKKLYIHRGHDYFPTMFKSYYEVGKKIGAFIKCKRTGKYVHKNNKIVMKLLKKKKQMLALSLQRQARRKKAKAGKNKR